MSVNIWLRGGLGNQLFQYSFGLLVSLETGLPLTIHSRLLPCTPDLYRGSGRWPQQLSTFSYAGTLQVGRCQPPGKTDLVSKTHTALGYILDLFPSTMARLGYVGGQKEKNWNSLLTEASARKNIYLNGYFIQKFAPEKLRSTLVRQIHDQEEGSDISTSIESKQEMIGNNNLAIHVRLGDNIGQNKYLFDYYLSFYKKAVREFEESLGEHNLIVFSDQPDLACNLLSKAIGKRELSISTTKSAISTLREMAQLNGLIATPSTFGWWAGFLQQDQSRIYMGRPWRDAAQFDESTVYPDSWKLVSITN